MRSNLFLLATCFFLLEVASASAQQDAALPEPGSSQPQESTDPKADNDIVSVDAAVPPEELRGDAPLYKRPASGMPSGRKSGGVRGVDPCPGIQLTLLAPEDHDGWTASDRPSLFWYASDIPKGDCLGSGFLFTLTEESQIVPVVEKALLVPERPGVQTVRVSNFGVRLKPDAVYSWSITLLRRGPTQTQGDPFAQASVRYVAESAKFRAQLDQSDRGRAAHMYAARGYWYDALSSIADEIARHPGDLSIEGWWTSLLEAQNLDLAGAAPH